MGPSQSGSDSILDRLIASLRTAAAGSNVEEGQPHRAPDDSRSILTLACVGLWAVNVLALFPLILRTRFRNITERGIKPWIDVLHDALENKDVAAVRSCAFLCWPHIVYSFEQIELAHAKRDSLQSRPTFLFRSKTPGSVSKAMTCITQLFQKLGGIQQDPNASERAGILGQIFSESIVALTRFATHDHPRYQELEALDMVWKGGLSETLALFLRSAHAQVARQAWRLVIALLGPRVKFEHAISPTLINKFFLDGSLVNGRLPSNQAVVIRRARAHVGQLENVAGLPADWVVQNLSGLLAVLKDGMKAGQTAQVLPIDELAVSRFMCAPRCPADVLCPEHFATAHCSAANYS